MLHAVRPVFSQPRRVIPLEKVDAATPIPSAPPSASPSASPSCAERAAAARADRLARHRQRLRLVNHAMDELGDNQQRVEHDRGPPAWLRRLSEVVVRAHRAVQVVSKLDIDYHFRLDDMVSALRSA